MLVGTIVIIALCTFASKMFLDIVKVNNTANSDDEKLKYEQPIRVNVRSGNDELYSFSASLTGYARYMAQISNIDLYAEKGGYTLEYIALVWLNLIAIVFMVVRFFLLLGLAIMGPIVVVMYVLDLKENMPFTYGKWVGMYATLTLVQVLFIIAYKIILETTITQ